MQVNRSALRTAASVALPYFALRLLTGPFSEAVSTALLLWLAVAYLAHRFRCVSLLLLYRNLIYRPFAGALVVVLGCAFAFMAFRVGVEPARAALHGVFALHFFWIVLLRAFY